MEVVNSSLNLINNYSSFIQTMNQTLPSLGEIFNLMFLVLIVFIYAIFIWKVCNIISKRDFLELDLKKYSSKKLFEGTLYLIEYIFLGPFFIFLWFSAFALFLVFLNESQTISQLLLLSAVIVGVIRMTAYFNEDLSKDLAKLFPFTILSISMTRANFFSIQRILTQFQGISMFFKNILWYLLFIFALELILRFFTFIFSLLGLDED